MNPKIDIAATAHNAVFSVSQMYGALLAEQQQRGDLVSAQLRARIAQLEAELQATHLDLAKLKLQSNK